MWHYMLSGITAFMTSIHTIFSKQNFSSHCKNRKAVQKCILWPIFWCLGNNSEFKNPACVKEMKNVGFVGGTQVWPSVRIHNACSNTKHQTEIQFLKWCFSGRVSSLFISEHKFSITNIKLNFPRML